MVNILLQNITDINTLEKAALELARQIMEKAIEKLEEELFKNKDKNLEVVRFLERTISTKVGNIKLRRRLYKDQKTG
ncbi:MAG TPA: ISLre2 family transposase, partial [Halanaerobiaceae bacterium]|nr:ISLre2 family transposase [Halanaerobiaceae bacterium]